MTDDLRRLAEAATPETVGRWRFRRSIFPNDPVNYAYVEWGPKDQGYGTGTLSEPMARYIAALSPSTVLPLLDVVEAARESVDKLSRFMWDGDTNDGGDDALVEEAIDALRAALERLDRP